MVRRVNVRNTSRRSLICVTIQPWDIGCTTHGKRASRLSNTSRQSTMYSIPEHHGTPGLQLLYWRDTPTRVGPNCMWMKCKRVARLGDETGRCWGFIRRVNERKKERDEEGSKVVTNKPAFWWPTIEIAHTLSRPRKGKRSPRRGSSLYVRARFLKSPATPRWEPVPVTANHTHLRNQAYFQSTTDPALRYTFVKTS